MNSTAKLDSVTASVLGQNAPDRHLTLSGAREVEVRIARSSAEVEELRRTWSAWPSHRDSDIDFCLEYGWTREQVVRPHVIVLYRDGHAAAILVGWIERTRLQSKIGYLRLPGIPALLLNFSYAGLLGNASAENCRELVHSILGALRRGEADVAILDHLDMNSPLHREAHSLPGFVSRDRLPEKMTHYVMNLPADVNAVYAALSSNHRSDLKRKAKKLLARYPGTARTECYRDPAEVEAVVPQIEQIAKTTYQRGLGVGFRDNEEMRRRLRMCANKGWLRAYILHLGEIPCAFWIGTVYNGGFCSDYLAFDPSFGDCSPGSFLMMRVIEDFCKAGIKEIDFGPGEGRYKEQFGNHSIVESSAWIFATRPKGLLLNALRTTTGMADGFARTILEKTSLLPKLKKLWRQRAAKGASPASS
jgi:hypothetical protein